MLEANRVARLPGLGRKWSFVSTARRLVAALLDAIILGYQTGWYYYEISAPRAIGALLEIKTSVTKKPWL